MSDMQQELQLYRNTLDWVKTKDFKRKDDFVAHYERYYEIASTHIPLINEAWNKEGVFRHGATDVRGTTSEMLTALYCVADQQWKIDQISDKTDQKWGSDILITWGATQERISVKSTKPRSMFVDGDLDIRLTFYENYFKPATWRVRFLSLVDPETKQLWLFNYGAVADKFCNVNEKKVCRPKFTGYTHLFVKQFDKQYPNCSIYHDLRT